MSGPDKPHTKLVTEISLDIHHPDTAKNLAKLQQKVQKTKELRLHMKDKEAAMETKNALPPLRTRAKEIKNDAEKTGNEDLKKAANELDVELEGADAEATNTLGGSGESKTFMDTLASGMESAGKMFEKIRTSFAYHIAPLLEQLQKLKIPGVFDAELELAGVLGFLGMDRVILFASLRRNKITPTFNAKHPEEDEESINELIKMAQELRNIASDYPSKQLFDEACKELSKRGKSECSMKEFAAFTKKEIFEKERKYARDLEKAKPLKEAKEPIAIVQNGGVIEAKRGTVQLNIKQNADGTVQIENKRDGSTAKWKLTALGMDVPLTNVVLDGDKNLVITAKAITGVQTEKLSTAQLQDAFEAIDKKQAFAFTLKNGVPVQLQTS